MVSSEIEAISRAEGLAKDMIKGLEVHDEVTEGLKKDPGHGFGMKQLTIPLASLRKEFSNINACLKCHGEGFSLCAHCNSSGNMPCTMCTGHGFSPCQWCHSTGRVQDSHGTYVPCLHCQNTGRIPCITCQGHKYIQCAYCRGQGKVSCTECGQAGFFTEVYQVEYKAQCVFDIDWREVPREVQDAAHKLGIRELATENHAEILWQPPEVRPGDIYITCMAFLPLSKAEYLAPEGRIYPALVAGLQGRFLEIEPVLDENVKPGINALIRLSKGPMARQALIDTACKYRLIRQVLAGLAHRSKRTVYQTLMKEYPLMLSEKYARATIKYAHSAVISLSAGPRYKGLALGTVLSALPAAAYYMTHLRPLLFAQMYQRYIDQYILIPDIIVWLAGCFIAVLTIKYTTAAGLKKMLPETVPMDKGGLPSAGKQGLGAFLTSGAVWFAIAARAAEKPAWIISIFKLAGLLKGG